MTKFFCDLCGAELPKVAVVLQNESDKLCFEILLGTKDDAMEDGIDWERGEFCYTCIAKAVETFLTENARRGKK